MKKMLLLFFLLSVSGCFKYSNEPLTEEDKNIIEKLQNKKPMYYIKKTNCKIVSIGNGRLNKNNIICDYAVYDISK